MKKRGGGRSPVYMCINSNPIGQGLNSKDLGTGLI